jgi:putative FmdB family regulatory protein
MVSVAAESHVVDRWTEEFHMPIYEYTCRKCGREFEALVCDSRVPACPSCQAPDAERMLSLFSVSSETTRKANFQAGKRQGAKERLDRAVAEREEIEHHRH